MTVFEKRIGTVKELAVLVAQSCPALCDPMDCSLSGPSVLEILQARILERVAFCFSGKLPSFCHSPVSRASTIFLTLCQIVKIKSRRRPCICPLCANTSARKIHKEKKLLERTLWQKEGENTGAGGKSSQLKDLQRCRS